MKKIFLIIKKHYEGDQIIAILEDGEEALALAKKVSAEYKKNEYTLNVTAFGNFEPSEIYWVEAGEITDSWIKLNDSWTRAEKT